MFKRIPGTKDILPDQIAQWQAIEEKARTIFSRYHYKEIRPPLLEEAALFNRSLGEQAEIVQKQMFMVRSGTDVYALRPEATASIVRAYIENNIDKVSRFIKVYYMGPMFRMERPQKGRLRQFHHIGCEAIGSSHADVDVEIVALTDTLLKSFTISGYTIILNSLGCADDKKKLVDFLHRGLKDRRQDLCPDCQVRFQRNVLRVLDCKEESCRNIVRELGVTSQFLCAECSSHFSQVKEGLDRLGIIYEVSPYLVRGLDYYTRTVFEIIHPALGRQQNALGAGGRYDTLVKDLGGTDTGAIGFAFGMERLLLALGSEQQEAQKNNLVYLVTLGGPARKEGLSLLYSLRNAGFICDTDYENKSLKAAMRKADDQAARFVLILGDNELERDVIMLKDLSSGEQKEVARSGVIEELTKYLTPITNNQ